jgi:hypothetical protein
MLIEIEKSDFNYFPKEIKRIIVLSTLYMEKENWKHEDTRLRSD